jgi:hypothetical protein
LTGRQCPFRYKLTSTDDLFVCSDATCEIVSLLVFGDSSCLPVLNSANAICGCLLAKTFNIFGLKLYGGKSNRAIAPDALLSLDNEKYDLRKDKSRQKIGITVATLQLSASVAWIMNNFVAMTEGTISAGQAAIPAMFLIEGLILFFILRGEM